jgi:small-conductance mechanosensitive channel
MSIRHVALVSLLLAMGVSADTRLHAQQTAAGPDLETEIATAPVALDGVVLFHVRGVSSYPAETRARLIRDRIAAAAATPAIPIDAIHVVDSEGAARIMAGAQPIMMVVDPDANLEQVLRADLAAGHLLRVRQAIADYRAARSPAALRRAALATLTATLVLAAILVALRRFWRWLDGRLLRRLQAHIHSVEIQSFEVMRADQIWAGVRSVLLGFRTFVILGTALAYVGFVLGQWPQTRELSGSMGDFILGPLRVIGAGFIANIPRLAFLTVLFFLFRVALRLLRLFFEAVGRGAVHLRGFDRDWADSTYKLIRVAVVASGLVIAYPYIPGSQSEAFKGVSLFLGIVFSLGSSSAVSNLIAGYMLTYRRAFKPGDRVKIGDAVGEVLEVRLQVTTLRSIKNEEVIIPNAKILAEEVVNYSSLARQRGLILHTEIGIGYETPWRQVEAMLLSAAGRTSGLLQEPRAFVLVKRLGDFAVVYELNAYLSDVTALLATYTAMHRHILDVFNEYGVQIMTPAYEGDPAVPKVVAPKDWYAAPASLPIERASPRL